VERAVDRDLGQVEPDDLVVAIDGLKGDCAEHPGLDPLITPLACRRVGDDPAGEALGVLPTAAGDQAHEHHVEAGPVRGPRSVTSQRVGIETFREQRFYSCPDRISHFGVKGAHDGGDLHLVVGRWVHPTAQSGQPDDRWMVTHFKVRIPWSLGRPPIRAATK